MRLNFFLILKIISDEIKKITGLSVPLCIRQSLNKMVFIDCTRIRNKLHITKNINIKKYNLRKIFTKKLNKNKQLKNYFDKWGSRLYMYIDELGKNYMFSKNSEKTIDNLDINTNAIKNLGGEYVLSGLPIENHNETGL